MRKKNGRGVGEVCLVWASGGRVVNIFDKESIFFRESIFLQIDKES